MPVSWFASAHHIVVDWKKNARRLTCQNLHRLTWKTRSVLHHFHFSETTQISHPYGISNPWAYFTAYISVFDEKYMCWNCSFESIKPVTIELLWASTFSNYIKMMTAKPASLNDWENMIWLRRWRKTCIKGWDRSGESKSNGEMLQWLRTWFQSCG